ncbi:MAG: hypothetical protein M3N97_00185 [Pseudomonadota bacterium]|nr:hypothetical protein [Pseudomonadota bacterium]
MSEALIRMTQCPRYRTLKVAAGIGASFTGLVAAVILLLGKRMIAVYRLIGRLE